MRNILPIIIVILIVVIALGAYFLYQKNATHTMPNGQQMNNHSMSGMNH